jgi:hypothetical protein
LPVTALEAVAVTVTVVAAASEAVEVLTDKFTTGVVTVTLAEPVDEHPDEFVTVTK